MSEFKIKIIVIIILCFTFILYSQIYGWDTEYRTNFEEENQDRCFDLNFDYRSCDSLKQSEELDSAKHFLLFLESMNLEKSKILLKMSCYERPESSRNLAQCRLEHIKTSLIPFRHRDKVILQSTRVYDIEQLKSPARLCVSLIVE